MMLRVLGLAKVAYQGCVCEFMQPLNQTSFQSLDKDKYTCLVFVGVDDLEHLPALLWRHLLRVPAVGDRLVLVVLQPDVPQLAVGHVLHVDPPHLNETRISVSDISMGNHAFLKN